MSDTEKKTETSDTAPYMKKDKTSETSKGKGNFVIPLILLLVSAIVIVATFYEDEYKNLIAQTDTAKDEQDDAVNAEVITTENTVSKVKTTSSPEDDASTLKAAEKSEVQATESVAEKASTLKATAETEAQVTESVEDKASTLQATAETEVQAPESVNETVIATATETTKKAEISTTPQHQSNEQISRAPQQVGDNARPQPAARRPYPYQGTVANHRPSQEEYKARVANAKAQAKQYHEMMQQRRQAYEQEMQSRHQQHEAAMQAQRERKTKIFETQKAVFKQVQQDRETMNQKIEEIHKKISDLHEEVHQIILESQPIYNKSGANQEKHIETEAKTI